MAAELITSPYEKEARVLAQYNFESAEMLLHSDPKLMPEDRRLWSYANFISSPRPDPKRDLSGAMSYWPPTSDGQNLFVTATAPTAVETSEHVEFNQHLAGPARRAGAYMIDLAIRGVVFILLVFSFELLGAGWATEQDMAGVFRGMSLLILFGLEWGYFAVFEGLWSGQTPGIRIMAIRVVRQRGEAASYGDIALRNLLRAADLLPSGYAVGVSCMMWDEKIRRLGDLVAGTIVVLVRDESLAARNKQRPARGDRLDPAICPELQRDELAAFEHLLRRLDQLSPARASELAEMLAVQ